MFNLFKNGNDTSIRFDVPDRTQAENLFHLNFELGKLHAIKTSYGKMLIEEKKEKPMKEDDYNTYEFIEGTRL